MAIKIVSLPALTVQDSTDIYEVSKNGTGSFKETRAQMQSYIQSNIDLYSTYLAGANANIDLQDSRPLAIFELSPVVERNSVTTQSTGLNTVANYRILGTVITVPNPIYVYALQYDVSLLLSGSTTVGIYDYDSQTLLVSDTVSVTDPIDTSGKYYTKTLGSPLLILGGPIVLTTVVPAGFSNFTAPDAVAGAGLAFTQWATGNASSSPIPLSFPDTFHAQANVVQVGSFIYSQYFIQENFTFNDNVTNPYALVSCDSVTRGSQPIPVMSTAEYEQITSYLGVMVVTNDLTPNRLVLHDQGGAWNRFAFVQDIILQNAYNNSSTGLITVLNDNSKPFAIGNDETNLFGPYGVYVSATRNLSINPTEGWFHFFEANDSLGNMVQYGALACNAVDITSGSVSGITDIGSAVGTSGGEVLPFFSANGLTENAYAYYPFSISDTALPVDPSSMFDISSTSEKGSRPFTLKSTTDINSIASPAQALFAYDTILNILKYFDTVSYQSVLTIDNLIAGTGITFDQVSSPGKVIANVTGSSPGTTSAYANFSVGLTTDNGISTTFSAANTLTPISINPTLFSDLNSSDFTNSVVSISGKNTPAFTYNGSSSQFFQIDVNLFTRGTVPSQKTYKFQLAVLRTTSTTDYLGFPGTIVLQDLIFPYAIPLSGLAQLNTGDIVYVAAQNTIDTSGMVIVEMNAKICTTDASQPTQFNFLPISATSFNMVPNTGYTINTSTLCTGTFPTISNYGSKMKINGVGAGGFRLNLNAGQSVIYDGASPSTVGIASTNQYACLTLRTVVANTVFQIEDTTGSITLL